MDENGESRVGFQEILKYCMKGGKMRGRNYFGLLIMLLFAIVTLLVPEGAMATDIACPDGLGGFQTHYSNPSGPLGTFCVEPILLADTSALCGSATCYRFLYEIRSQVVEESLSQANLTIPAAKFCTISILSPTERSVKIREYEPSTGFSFVDTNTDVITWDSLKLDPSDKENIDVYLTQTGSGPQVMELKTETGQQYVDVEGPICCSVTQVPTAITFNTRAFGHGFDGPTFDITYDACTGEPNTSALTPPEGDWESLDDGAFVCDGEPGDTGDRCRPWNKIKKLGPKQGSALFTVNINDPNEFAYFYGFGNKIFKLLIQPSGDPPVSCDSGSAPQDIYETVTFDDLIRVEFNSCGEPALLDDDPVVRGIYSCTGSPLVCTTLADQAEVFIAPGKPNGKPDTSQVFQVLGGPPDGAIIYANPSYLCWRFGIGCSR
jgi:hypothetical protein